MQFYPLSCYFLPLRFNYLPQHPLLKHPPSMYFPYFAIPSCTAIQNKRNYGFVYFNYHILRLQEDILNRLAEGVSRIQSALYLFMLAVSIVNVVPKYLNSATFSTDSSASSSFDFDLHSFLPHFF